MHPKNSLQKEIQTTSACPAAAFPTSHLNLSHPVWSQRGQDLALPFWKVGTGWEDGASPPAPARRPACPLCLIQAVHHGPRHI